MKSPSFENPSDNPYIHNSEQTEEPLDTPKKKEGKKEKDRKSKGHKKPDTDKEHKKEKKPVEEEAQDKKQPKKPEKKKKEKEQDEEEVEEKKQKRQSLVERSLNLKKLYEEVPIPRDPRVIARLMVAQHILAIQEQIEQPPADATPLDELRLLASLDFMGDIADTLENPEAETHPEIHETCETLVQLAKEALDEGDETTIDTLVQANNDSAQKPETEALAEQGHDVAAADSSLPLSGAALLAVLTHTRHRSSHQPLSPDPALPHITPPISYGNDRTTSEPTAPTSPISRGHPTETPQPSPGDGYSTPSTTIHAPRKDTPLITPERRPIAPEIPLQHSNYTKPEAYISPRFKQPESLAAFAVAAAVIHTPDAKPSETHREYSPSTISQPHHSAFEQPSVHPTSPPTVYTPTAPRSPNRSQTPYAPERPYAPPAHTSLIETTNTIAYAPSAPPAPEATPSSSAKIEHLPLVSLLSMAEGVSIGHGQRLRSAYEKGAIDKEGLVKILKSHAKHHDFIHEYKQQVVKHRNLVQSSPEFLTPSQPQKNNDAQVVDTIVSEPTKIPTSNNFQPDTNITDFTPTIDLPRSQDQSTPVDFFDTPDEKIFHATWLVPVLIGILIIAAGILLAFLILR